MTSSPRVALAALLLTGAALLPGCLSSIQVECVSGTVRCGDTCVATQTDNNNCGACGAACSGGNVCVAGACVCPKGQAVCNGLCSNVALDSNNCGSCGLKCGPSQGCSAGVCQDCSSDGCRTAVLAGCIASSGGGYLQRIQDAPGGLLLEAPANPSVATFPDALGLLGTVLLYADHDSSTLLEIPIGSLSSASAERLSLVGSTTGSKAGTTQVYAEPTDAGTRIYAMGSNVNALRIFDGPAAALAGQLLDAGSGAVGALGLKDLGGAAFDPGSFPEAFGKIGSDVFVPLNATGKVLRVDVSNPANAVVKDTYDLQPLVAAAPGGGLAPDAGPFLPSPTQAIARNGYVYVAANVLRSYADFSGADYGPPLVVRIDPTKTGQAALSAVAGLGADAGTCQNVEWLASLPLGTAATPMLVSCAGARTYDSTFNVTSVQHTALLLLNGTDQQVAAWVPSNGPGQRPPSVGRAVTQNTTVYVADETASRLYVLDYGTNSFVERVGYVDGGTPPQICPAYITDLKVVPAP
ncbi:MAG TPA: hypothetical protein VMT11_06000 [Myxococcaceae bacterium]|nr:hypothetical protein [Myxococcaceae bacterium]